MWRRTPRTGGRQSTGGRPATPAMRSVGGSASASRRYSAGPRVPPACARPVTAASPASAGCSPSLPLPTTWFGCPSWWGPRRSHARNLPGPGKNRQNQHKSLLKTRFSATTARVSNKNSTKRVASTAFFRILLGGLVGRSCLEERPHPLRDRFVEHIIVERVEKSLSVRPAFEEIQNLFLDRIGGLRLRNVTTKA